MWWLLLLGFPSHPSFALEQHGRLRLDVLALGYVAVGRLLVEPPTAVRARHQGRVRGSCDLWGEWGAHLDGAGDFS